MTEAEHWQRALEEFVNRERPACISRVRVLEDAPSTQDVAATECRGEAGLLVVALRQMAGRGRLGRRWLSLEGRGVAMTLSARAEGPAATALPVAVGVAVAEAVGEATSMSAVGIRWPNDVVERGQGRKMAGVLIESPSPGLYLIGIGVNVEHRAEDWPEELRDRACSIAQLGGEHDRVRVIESLVRGLDGVLGDTAVDVLLERWRRFDVLRGRTITVAVGGSCLTGVAEAIEPNSHLVLRTRGGTVRLAAATTSLVRIANAPW